jgi:enoyl-CoA hydratase/carnithine racemase
MKNYFSLLLLCLMASLSAYAQQPNPNFELYILAGQSNMAGRGYVTGDFKTEGDSRVLMLTKDNTWVVAKHPIHFDKPVAGVGPGLMFGVEMAKANPKVKIGLIPTAVGGTPIEHWLPGAYDPATKTHPYDDAVVRIKEAMKYGVVKGIIWHQGEANSNTPEQVKAYLEQLKELITRFRTLVGNPGLPFIAGELGNYRPSFIPFNTELDKLPAMVPYTAVATTEGLVHRGDTLHFDSPSADELGRRYAKKMMEVQKKVKK